MPFSLHDSLGVSSICDSQSKPLSLIYGAQASSSFPMKKFLVSAVEKLLAKCWLTMRTKFVTDLPPT